MPDNTNIKKATFGRGADKREMPEKKDALSLDTSKFSLSLNDDILGIKPEDYKSRKSILDKDPDASDSYSFYLKNSLMQTMYRNLKEYMETNGYDVNMLGEEKIMRLKNAYLNAILTRFFESGT